MNASNLTGIAYRKHMENLDKLGCYIFFIKKNGERYKKATWIDFVGSEKCAADVISRLEKLTPGQKFEAA